MKLENVTFILITEHMYVVSAITHVGPVMLQNNRHGAASITMAAPCSFTFTCGGVDYEVKTGHGLSVKEVFGFRDAIIEALMGEPAA